MISPAITGGNVKRKERGEGLFLWQKKPTLGYSLTRRWLPFAVWWAYQVSGELSLFELRVWFMCLELAERRCQRKRADKNQFRFEELKGVRGGGGDLGRARRAVEKLESLGLLRWKGDALLFPSRIDSLHFEDVEEFRVALAEAGITSKRLPLPRKVLVFIATTAKPSVIGVMVATMLRCLFVEGKAGALLCKSGGSVSAPWIEEHFEISRRRVHEARGELVRLKWLCELDRGQSYRNRNGHWVVIRLSWGATPKKKDERSVIAKVERIQCCPTCHQPVENSGSPPQESAGLPVDSEQKSAGPIDGLETSLTGNEHQKLRGASAPNPGGVLKPKVQKKKSDPKWLERSELVDANRFGELIPKFIELGWIRRGQEREAWECRARALGSGVENRCAFFRALMDTKPELRNRITGDEEREAGLAMQAFAKATDLSGVGELFKEEKPKRNSDYKIVWRLKKLYGSRVPDRDFFRSVVRRALPDWTEARWHEAEHEARQVELEQRRAYA